VTKYSPLGTGHIGVKPATNLFHAARYASDTNRAPTVAVTINWHRLDVPEEEASKLFRDMRRRVRRSWRHLVETDRGCGGLEDLGVHENPDGRRNTHWSVYVPAGERNQFERIVTKFLSRVTGVSQLAGALHFQSIYRHGLGSHMKYLTKGISPEFASYFHMHAVDQGFVSGRGRTFVGRRIGLSARRAAGWTRKRRPKSPPT